MVIRSRATPRVNTTTLVTNRKLNMGELVDKNRLLGNVFDEYDIEHKGELTPIQLQILYGDFRIGGISMPQVFASIAYICATDHCRLAELHDVLQEMDRRYFLLQDLRWEFSMLDGTNIDLITEEQARWLVQTVHGGYFSKQTWETFLLKRSVPGSWVSFAELEVLLCDIPSHLTFEKDKMDEERNSAEKKRRLQELEEEQLRQKKEREEERRRKEQEKKRGEELKRKKDQDDDEKMMEAEERKREEEEKRQMVHRLEEVEKQRKEEAEKYKDVEKVKEDEGKEKEIEEELNSLRKKRECEQDKEKKELLVEKEAKLTNLHIEHRNKRVRYQLKVAIKSRDRYQLKFSVTEFKRYNLNDTDMDLERAERLLKEITARDDLKKAMTEREIEELDKAIKFIKKNGFDAQLASELQEANLILSRLRRLERIRHEILELKQATVAEIRSYSSPPQVVHTVMTATLLILGHKEKETKDWKAVQALVGKTGKENLKRRCVHTDAAKIQMPVSKRVKALLEKYELDEVRDVSAGAATFFVWATTMIEEAMDVLSF